MKRDSRTPRAVLLALAVIVFVSMAEAAVGVRRQMPLAEALRQFQRNGVNVIFTTRIVTPAMRVIDAPPPGDSRAVIEAILAPHSLGLRNGPGGSLIVVAMPREIGPAAEEPMQPLMVAERIVVESGAPLASTADDAVTLTGAEIEGLPHLGDDVFRSLAFLPGVTTKGPSTELQLRGSRDDEVLIRLDGQELYQPYHLPDLDHALGIVGASRVSRASLTTAPSAAFGGRAAGALDMVTVSPSTQPLLRLGISMIDADVQAADMSHSGRAAWSISLRRGTTDLIGEAVDGMSPLFSDLLARFDYEISASQSLRFHELASLDELHLLEEDDEKSFDNEYIGQYTWASHRAVLGADVFVDSTLSLSQVSQERQGSESDTERAVAVTDDRQLSVLGASQQWHWQARRAHALAFGFDLEQFRTTFDYMSNRRFDTPLVLRQDQGQFALNERIDRRRAGLFAIDRVQVRPDFMLELGLRYDHDDSDGSLDPRISAAWSRGASTLRAGWGEYSQSHRPYELMVEDGDASLYDAEHSRQWSIGVEHFFARSPVASVRGEVYQRTVSNPRPRHRNLFDVFDPFPEGQFDRVRIAPESSGFEGIELAVRGRGTPRVRWWINYTLAAARDTIDGRDVYRETDHRHAINADVNVAAWRGWNVNAAWTFRTGWPATPITAIDGGAVLGDINSARMPRYHRLDVRLSRDWTLLGGVMTFYVDGRNLYNRKNVAGYDVTFESGQLLSEEEFWPGAIAIAGAAWRWR